MNITRLIMPAAAVAAAIVLLIPAPVLAHCDGLDGPVVTAARKALTGGNVDLVLIWVRKEDEGEIRRAFHQALVVRRLGREAEDLADMHFFETLVRIHRAGEGEPYTGLKPAGRDLGPAIPLADRAVTTGKVDAILGLLTDDLRRGVAEKLDQVVKARDYQTGDIETGREFVRAYVAFLHYVDAVHQALREPPAVHAGEHKPPVARHDKRPARR